MFASDECRPTFDTTYGHVATSYTPRVIGVALDLIAKNDVPAAIIENAHKSLLDLRTCVNMCRFLFQFRFNIARNRLHIHLKNAFSKGGLSQLTTILMACHLLDDELMYACINAEPKQTYQVQEPYKFAMAGEVGSPVIHPAAASFLVYMLFPPWAAFSLNRAFHIVSKQQGDPNGKTLEEAFRDNPGGNYVRQCSERDELISAGTRLSRTAHCE